MDIKSLRKTIIETMKQVASMHEKELVDDLSDETILLESGLDSLGFATVVALLEMNLGYDPFATADTAFYPSTLGEFVSFYHDNA